MGTWQRHEDTADKIDGVDAVYKRILSIIHDNQIHQKLQTLLTSLQHLRTQFDMLSLSQV